MIADRYSVRALADLLLWVNTNMVFNLVRDRCARTMPDPRPAFVAAQVVNSQRQMGNLKAVSRLVPADLNEALKDRPNPTD